MVNQPIHVASAMLALALASFGCDPLEATDENQYLVDITLDRPFGSDSRSVLVGSTFQLHVQGVSGPGEVDEDAGGLGCATRSGSGVVVELEDGEFVVEAVGDGAVELADPGISCPANTDILAELGPDRWSLIGIDPTDAIGRWAHPTDATILAWSMSPGPRGAFPDSLGRPIDDLRVAADSEFSLSPGLVRASNEDVEIRWQDPDSELLVPAHYDELRPRTDEGEVQQSLRGTLRAGESFETSVTILGTSFALPAVHSVPVESIASLELVPVYQPGDPQREWGPPNGVLAITRDGEGRRVVGAPIEFQVRQGRLSVGHEGSDALFIEDICRRAPAAPTARSATIVATLGQLESSVDLEWIAVPRESDSFDPPPTCEGACTCTSTTPGESTPGWLALFGLGTWLRLRRRSR
jgi:MYXO-CTERM domain-containing protein